MKYTFLLLMFMSYSYYGAGQIRVVKYTMPDTVNRQTAIVADSEATKLNEKLFLENFAELLGLEKIEGKKGPRLRIWIWEDDKKYVIDIENTDKSKTCSIVEFSSSREDSGKNIIIYNEWKNLRPKSGWQSFFEQTHRYQVFDLEGGKIQKKRIEHLTHMAYTQFEMVNSGKYRYYKYLEPSYYRYVDESSRKIYTFLEYINREFNVKVYSHSKKLFIKP
jgi:hypothetical protein